MDTSLSKLLSQAHSGLHKACKVCKWNPNTLQEIAFGVSCRDHGVNWYSDEFAVSIQIVQDPANTTPGITGRLCFVCNSENPTDKTAQHAYTLWKAAVALGERDSSHAYKYLNSHYWTNALMHGIDKKHPLRKQMEEVMATCANVLHDQITILSPKIIIANGKVACESLYDIGLITNRWDDFRYDFPQKVYCERTSLSTGTETAVYCTYHTSAQVVNTHIRRIYSENTEVLLSNKLERLNNPPVIRQYLDHYPNTNSEGRGMRVLLLHWLDIGDSIRNAHL